MLNTVALILSSVGFGGLIGALAKSVLDRRHLKFTKVFDYKERRYQAIVILMWVAMNPTKYEFDMLKQHRPVITDSDKLDRELALEYHNAMLYASNRVLKNFSAFLEDKSQANWRAVTRAMKQDLYL